MEDSQQFHRLYRPETFDEFIGSDALKKSILASIQTAQMYLFHGMRGCGKTTLARLIGKELSIDDMNVFEVNAADKTGVDDTRRLISEIALRPMKGNRKLYIIDEVHRLSGNAQDSLLKVIEEPPKHVIIIMCTTNVSKVVGTLRSRCVECKVKTLNKSDMSDLLSWVIGDQKLSITSKVVGSIIEASCGVPRKALVLLDQVKSLELKDAIEFIEFGSEEDVVGVRNLCQLLLKSKKGKWQEARKILKDISSSEPEEIRRAILGYMAKVILDSDSGHPVAIAEEFLEPFYESGRAGLLVAVYRSCLL